MFDVAAGEIVNRFDAAEEMAERFELVDVRGERLSAVAPEVVGPSPDPSFGEAQLDPGLPQAGLQPREHVRRRHIHAGDRLCREDHPGTGVGDFAISAVRL